MSSIPPDYNPESFHLESLKNGVQLADLERKILRKLRGTKSQEAMSAKLKSNFNVYGKWENGLKRLLWNDLVKLADARGLSITNALEDIYKVSGDAKRADAANIVNHFLRTYFAGEIHRLHEYLGITQSRAARWAAGKSQIPAQPILKLLLYRPQLFILFLERLQIIDVMPEFDLEFKRMKTLMSGQERAPYNLAVLYFLDTDDYKNLAAHDEALIARKLQLSARQVSSALSHLEKQGAVSFDGTKYVLKTRSFEYPASDYRQTIPMFNYWIYRSLCYLHDKLLTNRQTEVANASSFRVFSVSKKTAAKISDKIRQTHHEILQLIKDSDQEDMVVRVIVLNHFGLEESPAFKVESDSELGVSVR
jgi:hypothetical protein